MLLENAEARLFGFLSKKIREGRQLAGMSQDELSQRTGIKRSSIANIETNRQRPPLDAIYKIAIALERPVSDFLPDPATLLRGESVRIKVDGTEEEVPPSAAEFISAILEGTNR